MLFHMTYFHFVFVIITSAYFYASIDHIINLYIISATRFDSLEPTLLMGDGR
jgi:hypothetical protein